MKFGAFSSIYCAISLNSALDLYTLTADMIIASIAINFTKYLIAFIKPSAANSGYFSILSIEYHIVLKNPLLF